MSKPFDRVSTSRRELPRWRRCAWKANHGLEVLEDRRVLSADVYSTERNTPLEVGLANGTFETGNLAGWATFTTPGATLGGVGFPAVVAQDTNGDGHATRSAQFLVGNGGGGIVQQVALVGGTVQLIADVAVTAPVDSSEAGRFELLLDGAVIASHDFGSIPADDVHRSQLRATLGNVVAGVHEIRIQITRAGASVFQSSPRSFIDNVIVSGPALGVLSNDAGAGTSQLKPFLLAQPEHGELELRPDGSFRYVPAENFTGQDQFVYKRATAGQGVSLYTVDTAGDKLLRVDSQSGEIEVVGSIGHNMGAVDLVFNNGILYALNSRNDQFELVSIDPTTGAAIQSVPLSFVEPLRTTKGLTAVDGQLYIIFSYAAAYCGNACGAAHVLGQLNSTTGRITDLANYRDVDGGFNHDFDALVTDTAGRILGHPSSGGAVVQTYVLGFDPPSLKRLGEAFPRQPSVDDAAIAGTSHYLLSPQTRELYRFDPIGIGFSTIAEFVSLGALGRQLSGLAFAPELEADATTVTIIVSGPNAPVPGDDSYTVAEDGQLSVVRAQGVLANDTDPQSDLGQASLTRAPLHGTVNFKPDGSFVYRPAGQFFGLDLFQYQVADAVGNAAIATVAVTVQSRPDPPIATDDAYEVFQDTALAITPEAGLIANDQDFDLDALTVDVVADVTHGTLTWNRDGSFRYQPAAGFLGSDRFTYRVSDGQLISNVASVVIDVKPSPPPVAGPDAYFVDEDKVLTVSGLPGGLPSVLVNDSDLNGDPLTAILVEDVLHGDLTLNADGTFIYTPAANYFGFDRFSYQASDAISRSNTVVVQIVVQSINDRPSAQADDYLLAANRSLVVNPVQGVLSNDVDLEGNPLTAMLVDSPRRGALTLNANGSFQYTANNSFTLNDGFTYRASDGVALSDPVTVTIRANLPVIEAGHYVLKSNLPNQTIQILVTGGQMVAGADIFVMVGDGGPELTRLGLPAGTDGPAITSVDLKSNTIFASIPDLATDLGSLPQVANWSIAATGGQQVTATGRLATLTIDTTGFLEGTWPLRLGGVLPEHPLGPFDTGFAGVLAHLVDGTITVAPTEVVARHVFYNNSAWDGNQSAAGPDDDRAIATDKVPLRPGATASFANYTSFSKGINGVIVDVARLPNAAALRTEDFEFRVGRGSDTSKWTEAPQPQVSVRPGAGMNGSDRFTLIWADNAIEQQWLEVHIKASALNLLPRDDLFYFGNAIGESGNAPGNTLVTSIDVIGSRDHQRGPFDQAPITDVYDFNRDRLVSSIDVILARDHQVGPLFALQLITPAAAPLAALPAQRKVAPRSKPLNRDGDDRIWKEQVDWRQLIELDWIDADLARRPRAPRAFIA